MAIGISFDHGKDVTGRDEPLPHLRDIVCESRQINCGNGCGQVGWGRRGVRQDLSGTEATSDLQNLVLLFLEDLVHLMDILISQLLDLCFRLTQVVLRDRGFLLQLF